MKLFDHTITPTQDNGFFCRCMNRITRGTGWLCDSCPMKSKRYDDGSVNCRYEESCDEFPHYYDGQEGSRPFDNDLSQEAIRFAAVAHKGAVRKGNGLPYIIHPMETMYIVSYMTDDTEVMAAAALHDVIEDTRYTGRDIEERFGRRVAELVGMESEDKKRHRPAADTWRERKEENLVREGRGPVEAKMIMLSDKLSNIRATLRDYEVMGTSVWNKFNMKDVSEQEWYYRAVADVVSDLSYTDAYSEYVDILDKIF